MKIASVVVVVLGVVACSPGPTSADTDSGTSDAMTGTGVEPTTSASSGPPVPENCPAGDVLLVSQADVMALADCPEVSGTLTITGNVTDLSPLIHLHRVTGTLHIGPDDTYDAPPLGSLTGLEGLESVGGLELLGLENLASIEALTGLTGIPGDMRLYGLPKLGSLAGLENVEEIGGRCSVGDCMNVMDLAGLASLRRAGNGFSVSKMQVVDLHGLEALTEIGELGGEISNVFIDDNDELLTLDGLDAVLWHDKLGLTLNSNDRLTDIGALAGANELASLSLRDDIDLTSLAGLESLTSVAGLFELVHNTQLGDLGALGKLQSVGELGILGEQSFDNLAPLSALTTAGKIYVVFSNIVEIGPLPALSEVDSLSLVSNLSLGDLKGLGALKTVTNSLTIDKNGIQTIDDLVSLTSVGGDLVIVRNAFLPQDATAQWGAALDVGGTRKIAGNMGAEAPADPCPWTDDGVCDEDLGICAGGSDPADCFRAGDPLFAVEALWDPSA